MNTPGERFHAWTKGGLRVRVLDHRVAFPNRAGVREIERCEAYAEQAVAAKPTSPELLRYVQGIGEGVK